VAVSIERDRQVNLWIYDLASGAKRRIGVDSESQIYPVWSPDGAFLVFSSGATLAWARFDGSGPIERLAAASRSPTPSSFSPNGKWLAYYQNSPETENDLWISPVERAPGTMRLGEPRLLLRQPTSQTSPAISPDGRWVAYHSYESGRAEVYVMAFSPEGPANGAKWQVSTEGGAFPLWSQKGNLLFFRDPSRYVMVADCTSRDAVFRAGKPRKWAAKQLAEVGAVPSFDVGPDGRRVIGLFDREDAPPASGLHVMLNVGDELRRRSK
jgi:Tol biopolymer transport system component